MTNKKYILLKLYLLCVAVIFEVTCYPVDKINVGEPELELKDETRYDNGTVVGKYTYKDNDGNPIHVKYYADDSSYGVELNSVKVIEAGTEEPTWKSNNFDTLKPIEPPLMTSELLSLSNSDGTKQKNTDFKKKDTKSPKNTKSSDYETFYQNDIKSPRQCDKGKVRVYLDKEKRIIKRALDKYQAAKYCDRL